MESAFTQAGSVSNQRVCHLPHPKPRELPRSCYVWPGKDLLQQKPKLRQKHRIVSQPRYEQSLLSLTLALFFVLELCHAFAVIPQTTSWKAPHTYSSRTFDGDALCMEMLQAEIPNSSNCKYERMQFASMCHAGRANMQRRERHDAVGGNA